MTILIGRDIAPRFERAKRELVLATVGGPSGEHERSPDRLFSGVGSSNEPLVDQRGRYSNHPRRRLETLRTLSSNEFFERVREVRHSAVARRGPKGR